MSNILRPFLIGFFSTVLFIAGCSGGSDSGVNKDPAPDLDGDGIADIVDPDIDGDGIPNGKDPDDDNDGIEDTVDPTPPAKPSNQTCTHANIRPPSDEASFGDETASLGWDLLPEGCVVPLARSAGSGRTVTAKNANREEAPSEAQATYERCETWKGGVGVRCKVPITIPEGCGDEEIYYEIDEIKDFLQDGKGLGKYSQKVSHKGDDCPGGGTDPEPEPGLTETYTIGDGEIKVAGAAKCYQTPEGVSCEIEKENFCDPGREHSVYVDSNEAAGEYIRDLSEPTFRVSGPGAQRAFVKFFHGIGSEAKLCVGSKAVMCSKTWDEFVKDHGGKKLSQFSGKGPAGCRYTGTQILVVFEENPVIEKFVAAKNDSAGAGGEEGAGGSEPTFKVGNGEIETRDSTDCKINSSGALECIAEDTLRGEDEYFLVSYGVDGDTKLKYFNSQVGHLIPDLGATPLRRWRC